MNEEEKVTFFSKKFNREVLAEIKEIRKRTVKLLLVNGKVIIKKIRRVNEQTKEN